MSNETELIDEIASTLRSRYPDIGLNSYYDIKAAKDIVAIVKAQLRDKVIDDLLYYWSEDHDNKTQLGAIKVIKKVFDDE